MFLLFIGGKFIPLGFVLTLARLLPGGEFLGILRRISLL